MICTYATVPKLKWPVQKNESKNITLFSKYPQSCLDISLSLGRKDFFFSMQLNTVVFKAAYAASVANLIETRKRKKHCPLGLIAIQRKLLIKALHFFTVGKYFILQ